MDLRPFALVLSIVSIAPRSAGTLAAQSHSGALQPARTSSPSGVYELFQDPNDPYGCGPARMTLSRGERTVWAAGFPFTFRELIVTDDGTLFGWSESEPGGMFAEGEVRVAIISPRGLLLRLDAHPRRSSRAMHGSALPFLRDLELDSGGQRGVAHVSASDGSDLPQEEWWTYELRTGAVLEQSSSRPSAWTASEVAAEVAPGAWPPELRLEFLGAVELIACEESEPGPVHDVQLCASGGDGTVRFLREEEDERHLTSVVLDPAGELVSEVPVELPEAAVGARLLFAPLPVGDWVVICSAYGPNPEPHAWRVDGANGEVWSLGALPCGEVASIAGARDGGFALLGDEGSRGSSRYSLFRYEVGGVLRWRVSGRNAPLSLFGANEVAVAPGGEVLVLATVARSLRVYSDDGDFVRELDLEALAGRELNYPSGIVADHAGGVLVQDFDGEPSLWYVKLDGSGAEPWGPRDAAARAKGASILLGCFAEDGTRWASDRDSLMQLDARGEVVRRIGRAPSVARIDQPGSATIDALGRVLMADERTDAVHVYDGTGRLVQVGRPVEGQTGFVSSVSDLAASARGRILLETFGGVGSGLPPGTSYARFDETGEFVEVADMRLEHPSFVAGSEDCWGARWGERGHELVRLDEHWNVVARHPRRPDHRFWQPLALAAGSGNELAVVDDGAVAWIDPEQPEGALLEMPVEFRFPRVSHGGRWIAVHQYGPRTLLLDKSGRVWWSVDLSGELEVEGNQAVPFGFSEDRRELLALDLERRKLLRYALPSR